MLAMIRSDFGSGFGVELNQIMMGMFAFAQAHRWGCVVYNTVIIMLITIITITSINIYVFVCLFIC